MSEVGFSELLLVFLIGLIVLGPERLPRLANQLGTWLGQARRMTRMMKRQLDEELNLERNPGIRRPPPSPRASHAADRQTPEHAHQQDEKDDRYSPAHDADAPGTGVGGDRRNADESPEAPGAAAGERDSATKPAEGAAQERVS